MSETVKTGAAMKAAYVQAKQDCDAADSALKATPEHAAYQAARGKMLDLEDEMASEFHTCEACGKPIFDDEPYSYDTEGGVTLCEKDTSSWRDMLADPEGFYERNASGDVTYYTPETAKAAAEAHVAAGGSLDDKIGLSEPQEPSNG